MMLLEKQVKDKVFKMTENNNFDFLSSIEVADVSQKAFEEYVSHNETQEEKWLLTREVGNPTVLSHICVVASKTVPCELRQTIRTALRSLFPDPATRNANWDIKHGTDPENSEKSVLMISRSA